MNDHDGIPREPSPARPLAALERLLKRGRSVQAGEVCEMCAAPIPDDHPHVVNVETRNLLCSCRACHLLFTSPGAAGEKFRAVPEHYHRAPSFQLSGALWDEFEIPVRVAFFFFNSALGRVVAFYPSPAGATESTLPLDAWQSLLQANPFLRTLRPDVEALLVYGGRDQAFDCFVVPIAACYELTGIVKRHWRGFDGGQDAWRAIEVFVSALCAKSAPMVEGAP